MEFFKLSGKVALVTGSTRGIGRAIAHALANAGASVVITSEDEAACARTMAEFRDLGHNVLAQRCNLAVEADLRALMRATVTAFKGLDILVCSAGIPGPVGPSATATDAEVDAVFSVNVRSAMVLCTEAIPQMVARGGGSVIFIASLASLRGNKSIGLYAISKAALAQLARNIAVEWGPHNVRANCISPGLIATDFSKAMMANKALMERRLAMTPLRRVGTVDEVASVALLLAADAGGFITGQNIVVDGGTLISDGN